MEGEVLKARNSRSVIRDINLLTLAIGVGVIGLGLCMSAYHDGCRKTFALPVLGLGAASFVISLFGILGAMKNKPILLWIYVIMFGFIFTALLVFTVMGFTITKHDSGHHVTGLRYKEYQLQDCTSWVITKLNNGHNWEELKSCLSIPNSCSFLSKLYKTLEQYRFAKLNAIDSGCCRPPSECGYPAINASYYDLSVEPTRFNKDCQLYRNSEAMKCFNCDSCKAGAVQQLKVLWSQLAIVGVVVLAVLLPLLVCGLRVAQKATMARQAYIHPVEMLQRAV